MAKKKVEKADKDAVAESKTKLSKEDIEKRLLMTDYVVELLGYKKDNIKPSKELFMRIEGLRHGLYIPKGQKTAVEYPYDIIRYTFMAMSGVIKEALRTVSFKNEMHKINYILVIIEKNINDIYMSVKRNEMAKKKTEEKKIHIDEDVPNRFVNSEQPKSQDLFDDDIW